MKAILTLIIVASISLPVVAGTTGKIVIVPNGMYVRSDNPSCGIDSRVANLGKDPKTTKAIATAFGPKAAAVVIVVSKADEIMSQSGGDGAGLWNRILGKKDGASCAIVCLKLPANAKPKSISLSNRHGGTGKKLRFRDGLILENSSTKDFSGWRDVVSAKESGRWLVCGTATNWSHDQNATKRIAVAH